MSDSKDKTFVHKGAIRRLYFENFVTYSRVEIFPEPGLNVVIGPNGTGKSTIVCGICLGLAGSPKILGRQTTIPEFIKHGQSMAVIEIDLHNPKGDHFKIRRELTRDVTNHSRWFLNGRASTVKNVESFVNSIGIQINNLTQFLPQDRVSDFARMNSKELLSATEKAINTQLFDDHQYLKTASDMLKDYETKLAQAIEKLSSERATNAQLEQDVKMFELRKQHISELNLLKMKRPWLLYGEQRSQFEECKNIRDKLQVDLKAARELFAPMKQRLAAITKSEQALARELKGMQEKTDFHYTSANNARRQLEDTRIKVDEATDAFHKRKDEESKRCGSVNEIKQQISALQNELDNVDEQVDLQPLIDDVTKQLQGIGSEMMRMQQCIDSGRREVSDKKREEQNVKRDLQKLQDVNIQRLEDLRRFHEETYKAVIWLRANRTMFKGVIHEPMILTIQLHDPKNAKYLENTVSYNDMRAFICENPEDMKTFLRVMREELKLRVNVFGTVSQSANSYQPQYPIERYRRHGFSSYLRELFTAPEPVMRYLCAHYRVHLVPVGNSYSKDNVETIKNTFDELSMFFTENHRISIRKSKYSGNKSSSTSALREAKLLVRSFDDRQEKVLQDRLQVITKNISDKESELQKLAQKVQECERKEEELRTEKKRLMEKKSLRRTLMQKIEMKNQTLKRYETERIDLAAEKLKLEKTLKKIEDSKRQFLEEMKNQTIKYAEIAMLKTRISIRQATALHEIARLEAELRDRENSNQSIEAEFMKAEADMNSAKDKAKKLLEEAKKASSLTGNEDLSDEIKKHFRSLPDTVDELEQQIHSLTTRISLITNIDDEVVKDFESRKQRIEQLEEQVDAFGEKVQKHRTETDVVKQRWLGPLADIIGQINTNFSAYFAAIKCAGEVSLSQPPNPEDYNQYGICIKVKFRDSEQLCELTPFQQSGGERSVSTVLYMISLQELTQCPFRCVDEINQGMDPINERAVFDLVVRTACTGTTSQYFLFTPKLLANLSYSEHLAVLPVFNGAQSSFRGQWSLQKFADLRRTLA